MNYRSLREFLVRLEADGDLVRVSAPISTVLEMTEIQTRLLAERGPAVLFENPIKADGTRSSIPVLVNLFGTVKRVAMAVTLGGVERSDAKSLREVGQLLATLRQPEPPRSIGEAFEMLPLAKTFMAMKPKTVGRPPCQQIVLQGADIDLSQLPIQTCWPDEPAPLITWPLVVTKGPSDAREDNFNLGIYRMQVLNKSQTIMRWLRHRWRRPASPPLGEGEHRSPARRRSDRRRSRHDHRRGDTRARHAVRISIRGGYCAGPASSSPNASPSR